MSTLEYYAWDRFHDLRAPWFLAKSSWWMLRDTSDYWAAIVAARQRIEVIADALRYDGSNVDLINLSERLKTELDLYTEPDSNFIGRYAEETHQFLAMYLERYLLLEGRALTTLENLSKCIPAKQAYVAAPKAVKKSLKRSPKKRRKSRCKELRSADRRRRANSLQPLVVELEVDPMKKQHKVQTQLHDIARLQTLAQRKMLDQQHLGAVVEEYADIISHKRKRCGLFSINTDPKRHDQLHFLRWLCQANELNAFQLEAGVAMLMSDISGGVLKTKLKQHFSHLKFNDDSKVMAKALVKSLPDSHHYEQWNPVEAVNASTGWFQRTRHAVS